VLREYADFRQHFMRLSFTDERGGQLHLTSVAVGSAASMGSGRDSRGQGGGSGGSQSFFDAIVSAALAAGLGKSRRRAGGGSTASGGIKMDKDGVVRCAAT
jgi:hypothetical protein